MTSTDIINLALRNAVPRLDMNLAKREHHTLAIVGAESVRAYVGSKGQSRVKTFTQPLEQELQSLAPGSKRTASAGTCLIHSTNALIDF